MIAFKWVPLQEFKIHKHSPTMNETHGYKIETKICSEQGIVLAKKYRRSIHQYPNSSNI